MNITDDRRPFPYKLSPVEALAYAVEAANFPSDSKRRWPKPGALIERAPEHVREALRQLTSDDAAKLRFEPLLCGP